MQPSTVFPIPLNSNLPVSISFLSVAPDIKLSSYRNVISSQTVSFSCNITSKPQVEIKWIKDGAVLLSITDPRIKIITKSAESCNINNPFTEVCMTYSSLTILFTEADDNGEYVCSALYNGYNYSSAVQLAVYGKLLYIV